MANFLTVINQKMWLHLVAYSNREQPNHNTPEFIIFAIKANADIILTIKCGRCVQVYMICLYL